MSTAFRFMEYEIAFCFNEHKLFPALMGWNWKDTNIFLEICFNK